MSLTMLPKPPSAQQPIKYPYHYEGPRSATISTSLMLTAGSKIAAIAMSVSCVGCLTQQLDAPVPKWTPQWLQLLEVDVSVIAHQSAHERVPAT